MAQMTTVRDFLESLVGDIEMATLDYIPAKIKGGSLEVDAKTGESVLCLFTKIDGENKKLRLTYENGRELWKYLNTLFESEAGITLKNNELAESLRAPLATLINDLQKISDEIEVSVKKQEEKGEEKE